MTIRESIPAISTPTVVTVKTVHLYWIRLASVGGLLVAHPRATRFGARRSSRNTLRFLLTRGDEREPGLRPRSHFESGGGGQSGPATRGGSFRPFRSHGPSSSTRPSPSRGRRPHAVRFARTSRRSSGRRSRRTCPGAPNTRRHGCPC